MRLTKVLFSTNTNGVATITLNQPKSINALNYEMLLLIHEKLTEWEQNSDIKMVILKGAGTRGFCAGGDIKTLYQAGQGGDALEKAGDFFEIEYKTDLLVAEFPKPIIACLDGIVMGGGVGLSYGASQRLVTEKTKWAMPEMNIGFFPDVGAAYFLNKAPGYTGRYLALTATLLGAADILYIHGAESFIPGEHLENLLDHVEDLNWHATVDPVHELQQLIKVYEKPANDGSLASLQTKINQHFCHDTVEAIIESLNTDTSEFAIKTKKTMLSKSPVSLKVTLKQLIEGEGKTLEECLQTDFILAKNFMRHDDFFEGVRSVVIDKDQRPQYAYKQLQEVSQDLTDSFFKS